MWGKILCMTLVFLAACNTGITGDFAEAAGEMSQASLKSAAMLFIDPETVLEERSAFVKDLRETRSRNKRPLFEKYVDTIGANGILDGIEKLWPKCHSQAHDAGKIIYAGMQNVGAGLRICADRCYSGCMHGVLMEAFVFATDPDDPEGHIDLEAVKPIMQDLCYNNTQMTKEYSPGDCAHGVGHAMMFLNSYDVPVAIEACKQFDSSYLKYYCATGAYMEYVTENDKTDAETKSLFYPCDSYDYPGACSRYKSVHVSRRHYQAKKETIDLLKECEKLEGKFRLGCFHGVGNGHMGSVAGGKTKIKDLCSYGTEVDQFVCIEGVMERMAKYHMPRALEVCEDLEGKNKETCLTAVENGMYNMEKNLSLYLAGSE